MFHNLDPLRLQFERENLHEVNAKNCLEVLRTQLKEFFASQEINSSDHLHQRWQQDFKDYTIVNLKPTDSKDVQINPVQAVFASLVVTESSGIKSINNNSKNALSKLVNETQMQMKEEKVDMGKALDAGLVVTECGGTKSDNRVTSSSSGNYITHVVDADIRQVNDQVPLLSVAKLLAENEKLRKKNEHLKQIYKDLYDSIKKTRVQTKDHNDSLIAQINSKTIENADLKAQI
ncbi:hypothetical protein Tco_0009667 [Tanacetum coccineum]